MKLPAYPKYKQSGVVWLGDVPESWDVLSVKRLTPVQRGASPRPIEDPKYFDDEGEYAWVRIADVTSNDHYLRETTQRLSELGKDLSVPLEPGSLFLSIAGSVGKPMITKIKACIHDGFVYFPQLGIEPEFLYYIFESGQPYLGLGKLGTQLNLNTDTVGDIKICIPSSTEQQKIADFLDWKTGQIDGLISKKKQLIEKLKEKRIALITQAVTKGLNPSAPMRDSGIPWLGEVQVHWQVMKLHHIVRMKSGSNITSTDIEEIGEFPVYGGNGVRGYFEKYTHEGSFVLIGRQGALCGNINYAQGKFWASEHAVVATPDRELDIIWLGETLRAMNLNQYSESAAQPGLSVEEIGRLKMPFPPVYEQVEIANFISIETAKIDNLMNVTVQTIFRLTEYRTALITAATTGKIDVRNVEIGGVA